MQEYLQPKIGGKIRIFSLALENNILIKNVLMQFVTELQYSGTLISMKL